MSSEQFLMNAERANIPTTVLIEPQLKQAAEIIVTMAAVGDMEIGFVALSDAPDGSGIVSAGPAGQVCGYMILPENTYRILRNTLFGTAA